MSMANRTDSESRSIGDAKAHFAKCIRDAESGLTTVLTRHGRPVARIEPYRPPVLASSTGGAEVRERHTAYGSLAEGDASLETQAGSPFVSSNARRAALCSPVIKCENELYS